MKKVHNESTFFSEITYLMGALSAIRKTWKSFLCEMCILYTVIVFSSFTSETLDLLTGVIGYFFLTYTIAGLFQRFSNLDPQLKQYLVNTPLKLFLAVNFILIFCSFMLVQCIWIKSDINTIHFAIEYPDMCDGISLFHSYDSFFELLWDVLVVQPYFIVSYIYMAFILGGGISKGNRAIKIFLIIVCTILSGIFVSLNSCLSQNAYYIAVNIATATIAILFLVKIFLLRHKEIKALPSVCS